MNAPATKPPRPDRPNILWVCTDSQRSDTLGCYGNSFVQTPNLDRLAARGTRFTRAFTQSPLCTPSRGCFLTGRYPITNRLRQNGQLCPPDLRPITRDLRDHGYVNALVGKFHLNPCDARFALGPGVVETRQGRVVPRGGATHRRRLRHLRLGPFEQAGRPDERIPPMAQ